MHDTGTAGPVILHAARNERLSAQLDLPGTPDRPAVAARAVALVVTAWGLPALRSRRWLAAADQVLAGPGPLELFLQLDSVSQIVTLELWRSGQVVFGIDDWVGF